MRPIVNALSYTSAFSITTIPCAIAYTSPSLLAFTGAVVATPLFGVIGAATGASILYLGSNF
jgi:hypothetical protein